MLETKRHVLSIPLSSRRKPDNSVNQYLFLLYLLLPSASLEYTSKMSVQTNLIPIEKKNVFNILKAGLIANEISHNLQKCCRFALKTVAIQHHLCSLYFILPSLSIAPLARQPSNAIELPYHATHTIYLFSISFPMVRVRTPPPP